MKKARALVKLREGSLTAVLFRRVAARGGARLHAGRAAQLHVQDLLQAHHQQLPRPAGGHLHVCIY